MKKIDIVYLAKQNIKKKKFRSLGIVFGIIISSATLFASIILLLSMYSSLELGIAQLGADVMVTPAEAEPPLQGSFMVGKPSKNYMKRAYEKKIMAYEGVEGVSSQVFIETANSGCCFKPGLLIIGFSKDDPAIKPWIEEQVGKELGSLEIVTGSGYEWFKGAEINLYGFPFKVMGRIPSTGIDYFDNAIFMPLESVYWLSERSREYDDIQDMKIKRGEVSSIMVKVSPQTQPEEIKKKIDFYFPELEAYAARDFLGNVKKHMFTLLKGLVVLSGFTWVTALILVTVILSVTVNERKREFGILRAIGASKRYVFGEIVAETYILATIGSVIGIGLGYAFLLSFKNYLVELMNMPYILPSFLYVAIVSIVIIDISLFLSTVASFYPAYKSAEMEPYEAIRSGEV